MRNIFPSKDYNPSTQELINLFEISYTIFNFLEQDFGFINDDEHGLYFDYFGKSLSILPITATDELEGILLFLCFHYIDTFIEFSNVSLNLDFAPLPELINLRFHNPKPKVYLVLSISYFQLLKSLHHKAKFHPQKSFPSEFYLQDRLIRYDTFVEKFSNISISEILDIINGFE